MFHELDVVLIRALHSSRRHVDGTEMVKRQPLVEDQGTVVHLLGAGEYVVECVDDAGHTVWVADFVEDELASPPQGWEYAVEEISAGVYRATVIGPGGMRAEATDANVTAALASCREFALRHSGAFGDAG